ncbi:hypothetical protein BGW37DRAFT_263273 [Umbelopsis sp. PMI_123]|nr:hypothetical protein BGW37DRAFT_263273 [Umbelopsis sp. PMI_123]
MSDNHQFPHELLTIVFQNLCQQDLVNCSSTCWTWNSTVNPLLYGKVSLVSQTMFERLIHSISKNQTHKAQGVGNTIKRHHQLGQLIKVVEILVDYSHYDNPHQYVPLLSNLALNAPNVHTAEIFLPTTCWDTYTGSPLDWSALASHWPHLTNLALKASLDYEMQASDLTNINHVLNRLHHLNIVRGEDIINFLQTSPPVMPKLQSLKAVLLNPPNYQTLTTILQSCQETLHTLIIDFHSYFQPLSINMDSLFTQLKNLKVFGLMRYDDSPITITSFGEHLNHLEWWVFSSGPHDPLDESIYQAMIKTSNLKTLCIGGNMAIEYVPVVLEANKSTLQTFYLDHIHGNDLIAILLATNRSFSNVTTLCFECMLLENSDVVALAKIFPNVQFLSLCRNRRRREIPRSVANRSGQRRWRSQYGEKWIASEILSSFQCLKAIDHTTVPELREQPLSNFPRCDILQPKLQGPPSVFPNGN